MYNVIRGDFHQTLPPRNVLLSTMYHTENVAMQGRRGFTFSYSRDQEVWL